MAGLRSGPRGFDAGALPPTAHLAVEASSIDLVYPKGYTWLRSRSGEQTASRAGLTNCATFGRVTGFLLESGGSHSATLAMFDRSAAEFPSCESTMDQVTMGMKRKAAGMTKRWDPVDHLKSERDMAGYLEAALEDGDPALVAAAIGDIARAVGMTVVARESGLGRESLYKALSPNGNPELATILRVLRAVGLRLHARPA